MRFEWDANKAASNFVKHGVSFNEAIEVFYDPNTVAARDDAHSGDDTRFLMIGFSSRRLLFVVYAETDRKSVRIISARKPTRLERKIYEGRTN
jgi:uncharacterized DUF497 family protein